MDFRILLTFLLLSVSGALHAQDYHGQVVGSNSSPVGNASVIMLDGNYRTLTFARSGRDGRYTVVTPSGKTGKWLTFVCMGFERDTIPLEGFVQGQKTVLTEKSFKIKEVKVVAPKMRQMGDTIDYYVGMFKQKQDRTLEDVLKKMPGISVGSDGSISVGGKRINKFYIEGMDLLGNKYSQATENINAGKVKKVQVLNNHEPIKMLRGRSFSDQAALNIVLADDAKEVWQGTVEAGTGSSLQKPGHWLGDARLTAMRFAHKLQSISIYKFNNTGKDILHEINVNQILGISAPDEVGFLHNINLTLPDLQPQRTTFNTSSLLASNWLFKTGKDSEIRLQLSGALDRSRQQQTTTTVYNDVDGGATIAEDVTAHSHESSLSGELHYQLNADKTYLINNLSGYVDWNRSTGQSILNGNIVRENVKPRKRYISDDFSWIHRFTDKRSLSLSGYAAYNDLPGHLLLHDGSWENLDLQTLRWKATTWIGQRIGAVNVTYDLETNGNRQWLSTRNPLDTANDRYAESWLTGRVTTSYKNDWLDLSARLPLSWLWRSLGREDKTNVLFTPEVSAKLTFGVDWDLSLSYNYGWQPLSLRDMTGTTLFTNYISVTQGLGYLDNSHGNSFTGILNYRNISSGFFATAMTSWAGNSGNILYRATYDHGFYTTRPTDRRSVSHFLMSMLQLSESVHWCRLNVSLQGHYTEERYSLLLSDVVTPFTLKSSSATLSFSLQPATWLSFDANSNVGASRQINRVDRSLDSPTLVSFVHRLNVYLMPGKWQVEWSHELYHGNNDATSTNYFMDLSVAYRRKTYELSVAMNNVLGTDTYKQHYYTINQQIHQLNILRPREILFTASFDI